MNKLLNGQLTFFLLTSAEAILIQAYLVISHSGHSILVSLSSLGSANSVFLTKTMRGIKISLRGHPKMVHDCNYYNCHDMLLNITVFILVEPSAGAANYTPSLTYLTIWNILTSH